MEGMLASKYKPRGFYHRCHPLDKKRLLLNWKLIPSIEQQTTLKQVSLPAQKRITSKIYASPSGLLFLQPRIYNQFTLTGFHR